MVENSLICIINDGTFRHPLYHCVNGTPSLIGYFPIAELSDELHTYSNVYHTNEVYLDGHHSFLLGVKEQIKNESMAKYGENHLNINFLREV